MAYAVESFARILMQVLNPCNHHMILIYNRSQIQSLLEKVTLLKKNLQNGIQTLEGRIREASQKGEDIIEAYMSDRILSSSSHDPELDLKYVMSEFDSINQEMLSPDPGNALNYLPCDASLSPDPDLNSRNSLVGLEEDIRQLMGYLISEEQSELQSVAIVGMGGMGKTTLARKLYNDSSIIHHFNTLCWITMSTDSLYVRDCLLSILESLGKLTKRMHRESNDELGKHIYKTLKGTKYFIVIDDIWLEDVDMKKIFPDDRNGSRVLLTTRLMSVAQFAEVEYRMRLLDKEESWKLLCMKVIGREGSCPHELEHIGRYIVEQCSGHPISILVIAGILLTSNMTQTFWNFIADSLSSPGTFEYRTLFFLMFGYNHLPYYLRPCFLYMKAFRPGREIKASEVTKLWVSEGLIIPIANKTLEETAEVYLRSLINRNLLMVCEQDCSGKVKTFSIHDLLRDVSFKIADKENFLRVSKENFLRVSDTHTTPNIPRDTALLYRGEINDDNEFMTLARSALYYGHALDAIDPMILGFRLLRILDVYNLQLHQFPIEILQLVNLRYLAFTCRSALPSSISRFWNLQTLIIGRLPAFRAFALPSQVWEMTQLRHIMSKQACIWYCPAGNEDDIVIQENLQTLTNIQLCGVTNEVLKKFPNLKKLGVFCNVALDDLFNLASLHKLEILKCSSDWSMVTRDFLSYLTFPPSLKKLTLTLCKIPLGFMETVGSLPNLEQLKLQKSDFLGIESEPIEEELEPKWETSEGEFPRLLSLLMEDLNLVHWTANGTSFPSLKRLVVRECCSLEKIPCELGRIPTIELIKVDQCSPSATASAMKIKEQKDLGNKLLEVVA